MHEEKLKQISEIKECLLSNIKAQLAAGIDKVNTKELGEVVDMVKDLADAEKNCMEKEYYESIVCAMKEEYGRAGYDNWRYASGRFAPKGHGQYDPGHSGAGFHMPDVYTRMLEDDMIDRMGYPTNGNSGNSNSGSSYGNSGGSYGGASSSRGYTYDRYNQARRYYSETGDMRNKNEMNESAKQYMGDAMNSIREIVNSSDPEMQRKFKNDLANLINTMP